MAAAEAEAAEGHEEDRDRRDAGEGVHADVAVQLVGLLHLLLKQSSIRRLRELAMNAV